MRKPSPIIPTTEKLAQALEAVGDPKLEGMIKLAREGTFDDYKSDKPFPTLLLVSELRDYGHEELAERAINGEFDATEAEGNEWFEREGRELLLRMMPKKEQS